MSEPDASSRAARRERIAEIAALLLVFGLLAIYAGRRIWDIDVFWHVVAGRLFVDLGGLPGRDTFSAIDPDRPWIPIQWGYGLLVHALDRAGGLEAIRIAHWVGQWVAFVLLWWGFRRRLRLDAPFALALLTLAIVLYADRFRERPHVVNLLCEVALLPWLVRGPAAFDRVAVAVTAVVMLFWANLHAGGAFVFLCITLAVPAAALFDLAAGVPGARERVRRASVWYLAALLPAVLTPGWVRSVLSVFGQISASEVITPEWGPSWRYFERGSIVAHYFAGAFPTAVAVLWAAPVARLARVLIEGGRPALAGALGRVRVHDLALALAFIVFAHRSIRFVYYGVFAFVFTWQALRAAYEIELGPREEKALAWVFAALFVVLGYQHRILFQYGSLERAVRTVFTPNAPLDEARYPIAAVDHLERTGFEGNVFVQSRWGGYLLYRLWPKVRVTADGRGNFSEEVMLDLWRVSNPKNFLDARTGPEVQAIYEKYPVDALLLAHPVWPPGYLPPPDRWTLAYSDAQAQIWLRRRDGAARAP